MVSTTGFHPVNVGSIPAEVTKHPIRGYFFAKKMVHPEGLDSKNESRWMFDSSSVGTPQVRMFTQKKCIKTLYHTLLSLVNILKK